jgi:hypothetical protein
MKTQNQSRFALNKLSLIAGICVAFQSVHATLLFDEGFNYSAGSLGASDVNPFTGNAWSSGSSHIAVQSGNLTYSDFQGLTGNELNDTWGVAAGSVFDTFANDTSGTIYYSFLVDCTSIGTINSYLTSLNPGNTTPGGSSDALTLYAKSSGSGWELGVRTTPEATSEDTAAGTLSLNTTYLVVMAYTLSGVGAGTASLWVDPTSSSFGGSAPTADVSLTGGTSTAIDDVGYKAQSSGGTSTFLLDDVYIGTTWADVTPTPTPEPSTFVLSGLGMLGLFFSRRMRR